MIRTWAERCPRRLPLNNSVQTTGASTVTASLWGVAQETVINKTSWARNELLFEVSGVNRRPFRVAIRFLMESGILVRKCIRGVHWYAIDFDNLADYWQRVAE